MTLLQLVVMALMISSATAIATNFSSDITVATQEMQTANYFTFVMLVNMAPPDFIQSNTTFFMPNDKTLSTTTMSESSVIDFLLAHSIPSPLLMEHLVHFPTGSYVPTSRPTYFFKVTNEGRRQYFLNNVRVISPNICTKGSSIRCHGIDGVVQPTVIPPLQPAYNLSPPPCPTSAASPPAPLPAPSPPSFAPSSGSISPVPVTAPPASVVGVSRRKSSSSHMCSAGAGIINLVIALLTLAVW